MLFENYEEASFRLDEGVVLWNGLLFYPRTIGTIDDAIIFYGIRPGTDGHINRELFYGPEAVRAAEGEPFLSSEKSFLIARIDDPGFNEFEPFPIGYIYYGGSHLYAQRLPTRLTQQALTRYGIVLSRLRLSLSEEPQLICSPSDLSWDYLRPIIEGENHVIPDMVREALEESAALVQVSHEIAVTRMSSESALVFYEGVAVGTMSLVEPPTVVVKPGMGFLRGPFIEAGFGVRD